MPYTTITVPDVFVDINDEEHYIDVDVELTEDDVMDAADNFGMIVFRNDEEVKSEIGHYVDVEELLRERLEKSIQSPYEKGRLVDLLEEFGLL